MFAHSQIMAASIVAAILYFILTLNITIAKKLITQNNNHDLYLNTSSDLALTLTHYYLQHTVHASCHGAHLFTRPLRQS